MTIKQALETLKLLDELRAQGKNYKKIEHLFLIDATTYNIKEAKKLLQEFSLND